MPFMVSFCPFFLHNQPVIVIMWLNGGTLQPSQSIAGVCVCVCVYVCMCVCACGAPALHMCTCRDGGEVSVIDARSYKPKVMGSILDEVIRIFNLPNPSSHTMALRLTQPLTEVTTRNLPGGKEQLVHKANKLTAICEPVV
jgi:hypothetical protein